MVCIKRSRSDTNVAEREVCKHLFYDVCCGLREKTLIGIEAPRSDTNGACEAEVTVTSERHAQAERKTCCDDDDEMLRERKNVASLSELHA